ncbi:hydrogenase nickel incorporation protein HypB [Deinococcus radiodurans]|jgi:hydrogenase accessory protein HypB|uniref:Hydrogenase expression/formation HypB-related protein n=1 Tax=Deinococcus radiodurans (strain ATCC 13939 / DSM 20539 / JCM 16871 / CCUG 27074 / LMG 4051 / NBRC 15346 / NCIMB 9279 / VKM B-1422 / R1) TaxID=243230 RepID=Q9RYJ7_DEIRA|nr:hydrogenase nickel incorporation protein HypB [Deinococcus radiodurans]AAF12464.1 hydrogenase expression/formation HypB-related protein [Deinococcus radiodurans R1 = ATCC 13939 = DSM 20539]ANC72828.1 hydrogenase accessory protein HypB [Deinococcus radiodurans R1 = ATCC 13939 = DSM 20539]QEM73100.1 hydrogenase accessory protein HypB [Deinococcus radiodurans]QIP30533.1 hydrogenase nickel incorporation protein HypB [Deinococcus radiodurans]QIP33412.1 hydrogenase nickel incorporation protein Hy
MTATAPRIVTVRQNILKANDHTAAENRRTFEAAGVRAINLASSPGAGKTALLERTLRDLARGLNMAVAVGDLATDNDAARLRQWGAQAEQIVTGTVCHLDAAMVGEVLPRFDLAALDVLFLENVGNLVCPSSYDLGEAARAVLISTTEGEDKPLKYPTMFNTADVVVITKMDIADAVGFDRALCRENIDRARPGVPVIELSSRQGEGLDAWYAFVRGER